MRRRPHQLLTSLLSLAAIATLVSWGLSFSSPHAVPLPGDYGVRFERGTIQVRRQAWTRLVTDAAGQPAVVPAPLGSVLPGPESGGPAGAMLLFSPWRPCSVGSFVSGGSAVRVDGTAADFGYRLDA